MNRLVASLTILVSLASSLAWAADPSYQVNAAYLAAFAKKPGVVVRPSGLEYRILQNGFGARPAGNDTVSVYYKGTLVDGRVFDATEPGFPAQFKVNEVIPGWTEALELMREGDRWELVIPSNLAYGTRGAPPSIGPNQTLVFDVELVKVTRATKQEDQDKDQNGGGQ